MKRPTVFACAISMYLWMPVSCAFAVDHNDAIKQHEADCNAAVVEVARRMSSQINDAILAKDSMRVAELSRSLSLFLEDDKHPASVISVSNVADEYVTRRRASAKRVYEQFRVDLKGDRFETDDLTEKIEEFVRLETDAQKTDRTSNSTVASAESFPLPKANKPSQKTTDAVTKKVGNRKHGKVILAEDIPDFLFDLQQVEMDWIALLNEATTTLEVEKVRGTPFSVLQKKMLGMIDGTTVTFQCRLMDSTKNTDNQKLPYSVDFSVHNWKTSASGRPRFFETSGFSEYSLRFSQISLGPEFKELAESKRGTEFEIYCLLRARSFTESRAARANPAEQNAVHLFSSSRMEVDCFTEYELMSLNFAGIDQKANGNGKSGGLKDSLPSRSQKNSDSSSRSKQSVD